MPRFARRLRRLSWRVVRALLVLAAALGPGMPPPPPPPRPTTEEVDPGGEVKEEE